MTARDSQAALEERPPEARITDESIAAAKAMIGTVLHPAGPFVQDATDGAALDLQLPAVR